MAARLFIVVLSAVTLAACSSGADAPTAAATSASATASAKAALDAKASKDLALYEQMRTNQNWDLAGTLGAEFVSKYPDSPAAAQVRQTLTEVQAKGHEQAETRRLARLWAYSVSAEGGGTQFGASIASKEPISQGLGSKDTRRANLILRQHPQWGQSVYIYLDNERFDCRSGCPNLMIGFDDEPRKPWKATIPSTGEPSLFIDDDKAFIAKLLKTKRVTVEAAFKNSGKKTLVFETGGLDMIHLPGLAATKKK